MGIPENIDALLVKYDITQDHLARIAGVTSGAISGWRKGSTPRKKERAGYLRLLWPDGR